VQQGLDLALEDERPASINEIKWTKIQWRVVSMIRLVLTPEIKTCVEGDNTEGLTGEVREYLYVKVANQSSLFEDGVVSTQNRDERRSP